MKFNDTLPASRDAGRIRLGGVMRLPPVGKDAEQAAPAVATASASLRTAVSDSGRIKLGGVMRLPARG